MHAEEISADKLARDGTGDDKIQAYMFRMCLTDVAASRAPLPKPAGYENAEMGSL